MHDSLMDNVSDPWLENVLGSVAVAITGAVAGCGRRGGGACGCRAGGADGAPHPPRLLGRSLAGVLGLTHSGTVRLVDRLEDDGLLRRGQGQDARVVTLELTAKGVRRARARLGGPCRSRRAVPREPRPVGALDADAAAREGRRNGRRGLERGAAPLPALRPRGVPRRRGVVPARRAHGRARRSGYGD